MYGCPGVFLSLLGVAAVLAGSSELNAIDRQIEAVHLPPGADLQASPQVLSAAVQALQALDAAVQQLPPDLRDAGVLRLAEGYRLFAADLVVIPCPAGLDPTQCALFTGLLAERAQPVAAQATQSFAAVEHSTALARGDRRRLEALAEDLAALEQAIQAAIAAMAPATAAPPLPEPAAPQLPAPGWNSPVGRSGSDAQFAVIRGIGGLLRAPGEPLVLVDTAYAPSEDLLYVVELLGRGDGLAEIRLGGAVDWDTHCVPHQTLAPWVAVRAWIPEEELVELLAEELVRDHADGTGLRLLPGTPVLDGRAWLDGQRVPVPDGARTATDYRTGELRLERVYGPVQLPWTTTGHIGGEPFTLRQPDFDHNDALTVSASSPRGEHSLITLTERCGELRFMAPLPEPNGEFAGIFGALRGSGDDAPWVTLRPGTRVYWLDGRPAGQVVEEHAVLASELYGTPMRCLEPKLGSAEDQRVPLCFDPADLETP